VSKRQAYILKSSEDSKKHVCIDALNEVAIISFLKDDEARIKKFYHIVGIILKGLRISELYDKEDIDEQCENVTAMKMFKGGDNIRIYCKEQRDNNGTFYVIVSELLPKKKDQKVKGKVKQLIKKVGSYEYTIVPRPKK
jgi:hypothetical protein